MASLCVDSKVITLSSLNKTIAIKSDDFTYKVLDNVHLGVESSKEIESVIDGSVHIVCSALSSSGQYLAVCSFKDLTVWSALADFSLIERKSLLRAASQVVFTPSERQIAVGDKSGDVYLFQTQYPGPGTLILGHVSMLLDLIITDDEKFIITSDRDEKIRVSHFPNSYNIQSYCLGHEEFVTTLAILSHDPRTLISGSGDGTIRLWDFISGQQLEKRVCAEDLRPTTFIHDEHCVVIQVVSLKVDPCVTLICTLIDKFKGVLIYCVSSYDHKLKCELKQKITLWCEPWRLSFSSPLLWVLTKDQNTPLQCIQIKDKSFNIFTPNADKIIAIFKEQNDLFSETYFDNYNLVNSLYKRRFDNVQEYFKRKTERLEENLKKLKATNC